MPKRAKELTARHIASLKENGCYAVGGVVGLYLNIRGASRGWVLRIKIGNRRCEFGLGSYPEITLAAARDRTWARRRQLSGQLPASVEIVALPPALVSSPSPDERTEPHTVAEAAMAFEACAKTYVAAQAAGWRSGKHAKQWLSTLERYAFPVIGKRGVATITTTHVVQILQPIWESKTETATRVRGRIEKILDWAEHRGYRNGKNPARWQGNLVHELPSPTKLKKRKKRPHAALPYLEVGAFLADLRSRRGVTALALEWGILTAARSQEIRGARHGEISVPLRRWTIPGARMKMEKDHVVPLSEAALALFERLPPKQDTDLLFPAPEGGELSDAAFGALIDVMHAAAIKGGNSGYRDPKQNRIATQHGFRSTFRDWAAEVALFPSDIIEHALAHKLKDEAEAAYQRGDLLLKRAYVMERWAQFCNEPSPQLPDIAKLMERQAMAG
jgi:integrase